MDEIPVANAPSLRPINIADFEFHDGSLISFSHSGDTLKFYMESLEVADWGEPDPFNTLFIPKNDHIEVRRKRKNTPDMMFCAPLVLSKRSTLRGILHVEGIKNFVLNDKKFEGNLPVKNGEGTILDFELIGNHLTLNIIWERNLPVGIYTSDFLGMDIDADKIYWENIPDLSNPYWDAEAERFYQCRLDQIKKLNISSYDFKGGTLIEVTEQKNQLALTMESARVTSDERDDYVEIHQKNTSQGVEASMKYEELEDAHLTNAFLLSKENTLRGILHIEGIHNSPLSLSHIPSGVLINKFEITDNHVTITFQQVGQAPTPPPIEIDADKIYWENIPNLPVDKRNNNG